MNISFTKLAEIIQLKNYHEEKLKFVFKNWCVLLLAYEEEFTPQQRFEKDTEEASSIKDEW